MRLVKIFSVLLLATCPPLWAEVVVMPSQEVEETEVDVNDSAPLVATPKKGESMAQVTAHFGQPSKRYKAVGGGSKRQPPITRWDYAGFYVFFENSHVVRSVVPGRPPKVQHAEGLRPAK